MSYEPLGQGLWYFLPSFVGTLGFAILLHAPKRAWLPASLIGAMTYTLYWSLKQLSLDEAASMFLAALFGSLLAQFCARKMRMIATIFLLLSVVALVPGLGLYRCMEQLGHQQYALGAQTGILAMAGILMMALGLGVFAGDGKGKLFALLRVFLHGSAAGLFVHDVFHPSKFYGQHRRSARAQWTKLPVVAHKHTTSGRRLQSHGGRSDLNNY